MRKTLALLLIVVLIVSLGSGCGRRAVQDPESNQGENTVTQPGDNKKPGEGGESTDNTSGDSVDNTGNTGNTGSNGGTDSDSSASSGDWGTGSNPSTGTGTSNVGTGTGTSAPVIVKPIVGVLKDGSYSAHGSYDNFGWRPFVEIVISKGKIVSAKFDYSKANGQLKSADTAYGNMMFNVTKVTPAQAFQRLVSQLISRQDVSKVDIVTGATVSSNSFRSLAHSAILKANTNHTADSGIIPPAPVPVIPGGNTGTGNSGSGNTDTDTSASEDWDTGDTGSGNTGGSGSTGTGGTGSGNTGGTGSGSNGTIPAPAPESYKDGIYSASYDFAANNGWKSFVEVTVRGGKITDVKFDYIKSNGSLKSDDDDYARRMLARSPVTPVQASVNLRQQLISKQDVSKIDTVSGATTSSNNFKALAAAALTNSQQGIKQPALLPMNATYTAAGALSNNYTPEIAITYVNGKITKVVFTEKHTDSTRPNKRDDAAYSANYLSKVPSASLTIDEATTLLENLLVEKQEPSLIGVDTITGATSLTKKFIELADQAIVKRAPYVDGTYVATHDAAANNGWKSFIQMTISDGKITDVKFDYIKPDGSLKSADEGYAQRMLARSPVTPAQAIANLEEQILSKQNVSKIDTVTGATTSSNNFRALATAALRNAHQGFSYPAILPMNATYTASGTVSNNYTPDIAVTYVNGRITKVVFTEKHTDTTKANKRDDAAYSANYLSKVPSASLTIDEATTLLENLLVEKQDPRLIAVDTITGATSLTKKFKELAEVAIAKRAPYVSGEYQATYDYSPDNGWKPMLNLTVENGVITNAKFDYIKPDGSLKSNDEDYAQRMYNRSGVTPVEAADLLEERLLDTQDITKVDVVTGATSSSNNFIDLATALLLNTHSGDTTDVILVMNTNYRMTGTTVNGWTPQITITYTNGKITGVVLAGAPAELAEAVANLQTQLIQKQSVEAITVVPGAEELTEIFKNLASQAIAKRQ